MEPKNKAAQELAQRRHLSLTPERRREIAIKASKAASKKRKKKLSPAKGIDSKKTLR